MLGSGAVLGGLGTRALMNEEIPAGRTLNSPTDNPLILNDASELSSTPVNKHLTFTRQFDQTLIDNLRGELSAAKSEGRPFIASAARHSMGAQSMARGGTTLTLNDDWVETDNTARTYRCGGGTRWSTVIRHLDEQGFSPAVMQSNNDFGVAATYSVNAHGWPVPFSGCGSTVKSLKMMLADGAHITCSRDENADIFRAAMGGYGLFGVITELEMQMVPNMRLEPTFERVSPFEFGPRFVKTIKDGTGVQMAYGRMDVAINSFFEEALMITYRPSPDQNDLPSAPGSGWLSHTARRIFRDQLGSDRAKHRRWWFEAGLGPWIGSGETTRNALLNEPVITLDDNDPTRTDILHEYFVSPENFGAFVSACRDVIPSSFQELLNITLRYVEPDTESWLSYAPSGRIACVMLFSQEKSVRAEADMQRMTEELIDRTLAIGGSYYLPYRLHARQDQIEKAYPGLRPFAAKKRAMDPGNLFRHALWDTYLARA